MEGPCQNESSLLFSGRIGPDKRLVQNLFSETQISRLKNQQTKNFEMYPAEISQILYADDLNLNFLYLISGTDGREQHFYH